MGTENITWADFEKIKLHIGTIIEAEVFVKAIKPAYKLKIDFGELGVKQSSAQITKLYNVEELINRQVVAVMNFPPKQIANLMSECLVLGSLGNEGEVTLLTSERPVPNGSAIG